jgi:hypothetical protein
MREKGARVPIYSSRAHPHDLLHLGGFYLPYLPFQIVPPAVDQVFNTPSAHEPFGGQVACQIQTKIYFINLMHIRAFVPPHMSVRSNPAEHGLDCYSLTKYPLSLLRQTCKVG